MIHGIHRSILSRLHYSTAKTFLVYFNMVSDTFNHVKIRHKAVKQKGAAHGDELSYIFANEYGPMPSKESKEFKNIEKMVDFITGFAKEGSLYCDKISWNAIAKEDLPYNYKALHINDSKWKIEKLKEIVERMPTWDSLYPEGMLY